MYKMNCINFSSCKTKKNCATFLFQNDIVLCILYNIFYFITFVFVKIYDDYYFNSKNELVNLTSLCYNVRVGYKSKRFRERSLFCISTFISGTDELTSSNRPYPRHRQSLSTVKAYLPIF